MIEHAIILGWGIALGVTFARRKPPKSSSEIIGDTITDAAKGLAFKRRIVGDGCRIWFDATLKTPDGEFDVKISAKPFGVTIEGERA